MSIKLECYYLADPDPDPVICECNAFVSRPYPKFLKNLEVQPDDLIQDIRQNLQITCPASWEKIDLIAYKVKCVRKDTPISVQCPPPDPPMTILISDKPYTVQEFLSNTPSTMKPGELEEYFECVPLDKIKVIAIKSGDKYCGTSDLNNLSTSTN